MRAAVSRLLTEGPSLLSDVALISEVMELGYHGRRPSNINRTP